MADAFGYELLRPLASGTSAEVFLAHRAGSQDEVVVKLLRPELSADSELARRFLDEARICGELLHANVVKHLEAGRGPDGRLYQVTEYLDGEDLKTYLRGSPPLSSGDVVKLMLPVCAALDYLHDRGVLHRDIKPDNVVLVGGLHAFTPKLIDFGSAWSEQNVFRTQHGVLIATPEYAPPECIKGQLATPSSDLYSLGAVMYECVVGVPPFAAPDRNDVFRMHLEEAPPPLPEGLGRLEQVILRCLAKDPLERFATAGEVAMALLAAEPEAQSPDLRAGLPSASYVLGPQWRGAAAPPVPEEEPPLFAPSIEGELLALRRTALSPPRGSSPEPGAVVGSGPPIKVERFPAPVAPPRQRLGSYELVELIGEGGMGRVWRARHALLGREVALKLLRPELAKDRALVQRFFQEAKSVNQINHPHIVEIHDFVEEPPESPERNVYCVMQLLTGRNLAEQLEDRPVELRRAVKIVLQLCEALGAAHAVGVVHRDLKPDNIFLAEQDGVTDYVKVLDFGVAKLVADPASLPPKLSLQGVVLGTPLYMAPEQAAGAQVDGRADLYAVGTLLYELLAGHPPFAESSFSKLVVTLNTVPAPPLPPLTASGEPVPPELEQVVLRCLAKDKGQRYATMAELAAALAPFAEAPASLAPSAPPRPAAPARGWRPVHFAAAGLGGVGVLALLVLGAADRRSAMPVKPAPAAVSPAPAPVSPPTPLPEPAPKAVRSVALAVRTQPPGARVVRVDSGEELGRTPLSLEVPAQDAAVTLRLELPGYVAEERSVDLSSEALVEATLTRQARPAAVRRNGKEVSKDAVMDPYGP